MGSSQLHQAVQYASRCHTDDETELGLPYLCHVLDVVSNLRRAEVTDDLLLTVAALHDTVEHGGATLQELAKRFGPKVAELVNELTRSEPDPEEAATMTKDELYAARSDLLLSDVEGMSPSARTIKLADRLSNLRDGLLFRKGRKLDRYLQQTRKILVLVPRKVNPTLWDEIDAHLRIHSR